MLGGRYRGSIPPACENGIADPRQEDLKLHDAVRSDSAKPSEPTPGPDLAPGARVRLPRSNPRERLAT
jgi:hypothetical protein